MIYKSRIALAGIVFFIYGLFGGFAQESQEGSEAAEVAQAAPAEEESETPAPQLSEEELRLNAYLSTFETIDEEGKIQVLLSAAEDPIGEVLPLYMAAIQYAVNNEQQISTSTSLQEIVALSLPRIQESGSTDANAQLWILFQAHEDITFRLEILDVLGQSIRDDRVVTREMAAYLNSLISGQGSNASSNVQVIAGLVDALSSANDPEAVGALVGTIVARVDAGISSRAFSILREAGGLPQAFFRAFRLALGEGKRSVYQDFLASDEVTIEEKVEFASLVLDNILSSGTRDSNLQRIFVDLRRNAVQLISENNRDSFAPLLVRHFNETIVSYDRGLVDKINLVEAIGALGTTRSPVAARRLTEFLSLINTYTQQDRPYDRQITLAVIENLRNLRSVESYNALFMVTVLSYPNPLKDAARQALDLIAR